MGLFTNTFFVLRSDVSRYAGDVFYPNIRRRRR